MKPMITIPLTKDEAIKLIKILYKDYYYRENSYSGFDRFENRLLDDLTDLLEVKPWDL